MARSSWCWAGVMPADLGLLLAPAEEAPQPGPQRQQVLVVGVRQSHRNTIPSFHDGDGGWSVDGEFEEEKTAAAEELIASDVVGPDLRPPGAAERILGDFTTTPAILRLVPLALFIGALSAGIALVLLDMIGFLTNLLYYQRISVQLVSPNAEPARCDRHRHPRLGRPGRRAHGALRLRADPGPWDPRSHGADPDQREPSAAQAGAPQAGVERREHRQRRSVRRRGPDHPDRRGRRFGHRAAVSP